ncbi:MAG: endonuclease/exonuclease/phosphatase family protein, partial [Hyphomicrobiaceae bacterium]
RATLVSARDHIRVLSLNSWHAHPDIDQVERGIERANADVVVLLEVGPDKKPMLDRLSALYPHRRSCADRWECSVAILSRFPIRSGDARRTQLELPPLAWAEIDASALGLGTLTVVGAHVHRPSRSPRIHRLHMRALSALALSTQGPLIIAGDFNTGTLSASWRELVTVSGLRGSAQWAPTWPAIPLSAPQVDLDHILISPGMVFGRTGTGPHVGSDHIGIWAEVRLPALLPIKKIDHASVFQLH